MAPARLEPFIAPTPRVPTNEEFEELNTGITKVENDKIPPRRSRTAIY